MTDRDVVEAAAEFMPGRATVRACPLALARARRIGPMWTIAPGGKHADTLMSMVLDYMGERRSAKIRGLLEATVA